MRVLGLDVGSVRVGVALSDELRITASPFETIDVSGDWAKVAGRIAALVQEHGVSQIVLGLPLTLSGESGGLSVRRARRLGDRLKDELNIDVAYWDERFSTTEAERVLVGAGLSRKNERALWTRSRRLSFYKVTSMPKKKSNSKAVPRILAFAVICCIVVGYLAVDFFVIYPHRSQQGEGALVTVEVKKGIGPRALSQTLFDAGLIDRPFKFSLWLRFGGGFKKIRFGQFELREGMSPHKIIRRLMGRDDSKGRRLTVPEGFTLSQIASLLEQERFASAKEFLATVTDPTILKRLEIPGPSAEGYLFPDTYYFSERADTVEIVETFHQNFRSKVNRFGSGDSDRLFKTIILASIVQAEARFNDEMPIISGVYSNRLNPAVFPVGLLQADPTVAYGCEPHVIPKAPSCLKFKGTLYRKQLSDPDNQYNTYAHKGLPPGPICAPGIKALEAAFNPATVPYLFFVADDKGRHHFSKTLEEHNRAVNKYRR